MTSPSASGRLAPPARFDAPWELRTYVIAVALVEGKLLDPNTLEPSGKKALRAWVETLQEALLAEGHVSPEELNAEMARQVAIAASRAVH